MMYNVMMMDEATFDYVVVATFATEAEAEVYIAECNTEDIADFGKVIDDLWVEEA